MPKSAANFGHTRSSSRSTRPPPTQLSSERTRRWVKSAGRFSGLGQSINWITADIFRILDGVLVEHWDMIQDEASREQSQSGLSMFGDMFPK